MRSSAPMTHNWHGEKYGKVGLEPSESNVAVFARALTTFSQRALSTVLPTSFKRWVRAWESALELYKEGM